MSDTPRIPNDDEVELEDIGDEEIVDETGNFEDDLEDLEPESAPDDEPAQVVVGQEDGPDLDELRREAEEAAVRLAEAESAAGVDHFDVDKAVDRTRELRQSAPAEHDSRVDELSEERATHPTAPMPWVRPSSLEAPPPRDGMTQRWIRISTWTPSPRT